MGGPATPHPFFKSSGLRPPQPSNERAGFPPPVFPLREGLGSELDISHLHMTLEGPVIPPPHNILRCSWKQKWEG